MGIPFFRVGLWHSLINTSFTRKCPHSWHNCFNQNFGHNTLIKLPLKNNWTVRKKKKKHSLSVNLWDIDFIVDRLGVWIVEGNVEERRIKPGWSKGLQSPAVFPDVVILTVQFANVAIVVTNFEQRTVPLINPVSPRWTLFVSTNVRARKALDTIALAASPLAVQGTCCIAYREISVTWHLTLEVN